MMNDSRHRGPRAIVAIAALAIGLAGAAAVSTPASAAGTGRYHSCAVRGDGTLWCWGGSISGQLGLGDGLDRRAPVQVGSATTWASVAAGGEHTCGLRTDGTLWCWGNNVLGQLGNGTTVGQRTPVQVGSATTWASVAPGRYHTCGLRTDGTLWCWGHNWEGRLGISGNSDRVVTIPMQVGTAATWASVDAGGMHTCAIDRESSLWCWGANYAGQLGLGTVSDDNQTTPVRVGAAGGWASVSSGSHTTCAIRTDGTLWCWGVTDYGEDGSGQKEYGLPSPTQVGTLTTWTNVDSGTNHMCAVRTDGTLWCWGSNEYGQLGIGVRDPELSPVPLRDATGATTWTRVFAAHQHTCGLRTDSTLWCWGENEDGQVGGGTATEIRTPVKVMDAAS